MSNYSFWTSNLEYDADTSQKAMDHFAELYEASKNIGLDSEYSNFLVDAGDRLREMEYFGAREAVTTENDIVNGEMELELEDGSLRATYRRSPRPHIEIKGDLPSEHAERLEDDLGVKFGGGLSNIMSSAKEYSKNMLRIGNQ